MSSLSRAATPTGRGVRVAIEREDIGEQRKGGDGVSTGHDHDLLLLHEVVTRKNSKYDAEHAEYAE